MPGALGRLAPPDWRHVERWPLTAATVPAKPTPMTIGVNWYEAFDAPQQDSAGHWWIGRDPNRLGRIRGGHCVALKARGQSDPVGWWEFYDQGVEGACTGFGASRMMSLLNRKRYDARWLYLEAQLVDEWASTPPEEGSSVRAALDILRLRGHREVRANISRPENPREGIAANRWATSTDDALRALGYEGVGYVDVLNSWGRRGYPHLTRMPAETFDRLRREDGELGIVVDR